MPPGFRRLRRYLQAHGVRDTAVAVLHKLRGLLYAEQRMIVIVKDLGSIIVPARRGELRLEDLEARHLHALSELNRKREQREADRRFARYVREGFRGFVAYRADELIGYYWWVDRDTPTPFPDLRKLGLGIELGVGDVYGSDFFLLEQHRGGGSAEDFLYKLESSLRERGYEQLWGYVVSSNRPARWIYSTRGYTPMWIVSRRRVAMLSRTTRKAP